MIGAICHMDLICQLALFEHCRPLAPCNLHLTRARFRAYAIRYYPLIALGLGALAAYAWAHY